MNKINAVYVSLVALVVAIVALVMCIVCCNGKSGSVAAVEQALTEKPQLVIDAMRNFENQQREEAAKKAREMLEKSADELVRNPDDGFLGNPEGKVVLVEFFDYSCGYCHKIYPILKNVLAKNPELKVVAKPLSFLSPMSKYAAKASLAAKEQGKFAEVYTAIFEIKGPMTEAKVDEVVAATGVDMERLKADMESDKVKTVMQNTSNLANKIEVHGVPTLVLNNKIIQTLDEAVLQKAIDEAK